MKPLLLSAVALLLAFVSAAGQEATPKPFSFKSGIVEYKYSGDKTGKSIQYIDDYGMKTAMYSEITQEGETTRSWVVSYGDFQYMWDPPKIYPGYENEKSAPGLDQPVVKKTLNRLPSPPMKKWEWSGTAQKYSSARNAPSSKVIWARCRYGKG